MVGSIGSGERKAILEGAEGLLARNRKSGMDPRTGQAYSYVCPALGHYPWQWFWDSCFHAIALSNIDLELAKSELRSLMASQQEDGFIPHVTYWGRRFVINLASVWQTRISLAPKCTALMQPPVLAQAVLRVAERSQDRDFLQQSLDKVKRYYLWLHDFRDPDADGLVSVISPYETGMDNLPAYDMAMGAKNPSRLGLQLRARALDVKNLLLGRNYNLDVIFKRDMFNVEDVMVNCIYAQGLRATSELCAMAGDEPGRDAFARMAKRTEQAILTKCYDPSAGAFWSLAKKSETPLKALTCASLFPIILESIDTRRLDELVGLLTREDTFWLPYPMPSVARCERSFRPSEEFLIWRGPTWLNVNWFIVKGLERRGYHEVARVIARRSAELVTKSGFREFYNPFTGEGYGAKGFGWSTLVVDML